MKSLLRWLFTSAILACLFSMPITSVEGKIKPKKLASVWPNYSSIAVDPAGIPHAVYVAPDDHRYHAWFDGRRWQHELLDPSPYTGGVHSLAIDAQGGLHVSYREVTPLGKSNLIYATLNGNQWEITNLGVVGYHPVLKIDQIGRPHIAYEAPDSTGGINAGYTIHHAWHDGDGWNFEDTGFVLGGPKLSGTNRHDFVLDTQDHAHLAFSHNYDGRYYATNVNGIWESTLLDSGNSTPMAIAVDSQNYPHVVAGVTSSVKRYQYDGTNWTSELILDSSDIGNASIDELALTIDAEDREHLLMALNLEVGLSVYAFDNGLDWVTVVLDKKDAGSFPSITLDPSGVAYATYCAALNKRKSQAKWVHLALPDLAGSWDGVTVTEDGGEWNVTGTLSIKNNGLEKAAKNSGLLYVSDDAEFDESDTVLPVAFKVKSLKPGATVNVPVDFQYNTSLAGKYLIAVIDPEMLTYDRNMTDNIVSVLVEP
jgi:CARDB